MKIYLTIESSISNSLKLIKSCNFRISLIPLKLIVLETLLVIILKNLEWILSCKAKQFYYGCNNQRLYFGAPLQLYHYMIQAIFLLYDSSHRFEIV